MCWGVVAGVVLFGLLVTLALQRRLVLFAVDGDTLFVSTGGRTGERVRLIGVNAAERGRGERAARAHERLDGLTRGRRLVITFRGRDRYGRRLAYVETGTRDLGLLLVEEGLVRATPFEHERRDAYLAVQRKARTEERGIWDSVKRA